MKYAVKYMYIHAVVLFLAVTLTMSMLVPNDKVTYSSNSAFQNKLVARIKHVISKEYSITSFKNIYVGLVNYPQWFVSISTGLHHGLTTHGKLEGSESLYPTNVTQNRWLTTFNGANLKTVNYCKKVISGWTEIPNLELVMYSQMMVVCLSSNHIEHSVTEWYNKCWRGYHSSCNLRL